MRWRWALCAPVIVWLGWCAFLHRIDLPRYLDRSPDLIAGVFHVHSAASHDCFTKPTSLRAAAAANGLQFVVLTDHNIREPGPCDAGGPCLLSFSELSTAHGHLIAFGATEPLDRAFRRQTQVSEAVQHLGAMPIVAHPSDRKRPWTGSWDAAQGLEVANVASAARRYGGSTMLGLLPLFFGYAASPQLMLMQLVDRDDEALAFWDARPAQPLVGLSGLDAHGWVPSQDIMQSWQLGLPSPAAPHDLETYVIEALRQGQFFCYSGLLGDRPRFALMARRHDGTQVPAAATLPQADVAALEIVAPRVSVGGVEIVVWHNAQTLLRTEQATAHVSPVAPGTYRVEVWAKLPDLSGRPQARPILYSNRLTVTSSS